MIPMTILFVVMKLVINRILFEQSNLLEPVKLGDTSLNSFVGGEECLKSITYQLNFVEVDVEEQLEKVEWNIGY